MVPYVDFQFVLPKTAGLALWWWFGWLFVGSISIYLLFTWWYARQAVREDEIAAIEEAEKARGGGGPSSGARAQGHADQGPSGTA